jgi:hypothetical protein
MTEDELQPPMPDGMANAVQISPSATSPSPPDAQWPRSSP